MLLPWSLSMPEQRTLPLLWVPPSPRQPRPRPPKPAPRGLQLELTWSAPPVAPAPREGSQAFLELMAKWQRIVPDMQPTVFKGRDGRYRQMSQADAPMSNAGARPRSVEWTDSVDGPGIDEAYWRAVDDFRWSHAFASPLHERVWECFADGLSQREIARELAIGLRRVSTVMIEMFEEFHALPANRLFKRWGSDARRKEETP